MEFMVYLPYVFVGLIVLYIGSRLITYAYFKSKLDFLSFINRNKKEVENGKER